MAMNNIIKKILDEALTPAQRAKRGRTMKRLAPKVARARKRAMKRRAGKEKLMQRATKAARKIIEKKLLAGKNKADLAFAQRSALEKKVAKKKSAIQRIAKRLLPKIKKKETERLSNKKND